MTQKIKTYPIVKHEIQKHILGVLIDQKIARFRDMRPPQSDSNLYSYHLNQILRNGFVKKVEGGYTLDTVGLIYADRFSTKKLSTQQPKIVTMLVIQNENGDVLMQRRDKQPFIDEWTLPNGNVHNDDESLLGSAKRETFEKLGLENQDMHHAGDCYIRINHNNLLVSASLAHVFTFNRDNIATNEHIQWMRPHKLSQYDLAPCVEQIMARTFFRDPFFFEEFSENC